MNTATQNPRTSNTGVVITTPSCDAIIDWMSFTVPSGPDGVAMIAADLAYSLTGGSDVPALERGAMGYTHGYRLPGSGVILYNPARIDMGVHVSLPSKALGMILHDPKRLIELVLQAGGKFTRVDVALDSTEVHISTVNEAIKRGDLVSRSIERTYQGSYTDDGYTIYIGARTSDRFVRIYNKAVEQKLEDGSTWTRCEVEFKKGQAQVAAGYIHDGVDLRSLIFSAIDFRDRAVDKNTSRCPQLDWWAAWVGVVEKVSFAIKTVEKTVREIYGWVQKQVAPSLAFLDEYLGKNQTWLYELCDSNKDRIPTARLRMIEATPLPERTISLVAPQNAKAEKPSPPAKSARQGIVGLVDKLLDAGVPRQDLDMHVIMATA